MVIVHIDHEGSYLIVHHQIASARVNLVLEFFELEWHIVFGIWYIILQIVIFKLQ